MHRDFWEAGLRVIGLHPITNGVCGCGNKECHMAGKHPWSSNWQHTPDWSDEQLSVMEQSGQFQTGYGVLVSGLLVIDIDPRNGGSAGYAALVEQFPEITGAGLIVATGRGDGGKHIYFRLSKPLPLVTKLSEFPGIDFKSSGFVVGPGSQHISGGKYTVLHGTPDDIDEPPQALLDALKKPERHRVEVNGASTDISHTEIADMLGHLEPDCDYDDWISIGMAVHDATDGTGFDLWDAWSNGSDKYPGKAKLGQHWHSFGKSANPVTLGTLIYKAEQNGYSYTASVPDDLAEYWTAEPKQTASGEPDTSGIDLTRPPGFVGDVAHWINSQCRFPREHLATGAALLTVGNAIGLQYIDERDAVTGNLFVFGVAESGSGKEAILQATTDLHVAAGLASACHGSIKSEQEIVSNLVRNQAAFYMIDEIGIFLQKVKNAQRRGGAIYLDGVIGMLMAAYSKARGRLLLSGDKRDDVRKEMQQQLSQIYRKMDEGKRDLEPVAQALEARMSSLDEGLDRPFLSAYGVTTPVTFDDLIDYQNAMNGFIGRALVFNERENVPKAKRDFVRPPMDDAISARLKSIVATGDYDQTNKRVEYYGERVTIPTDRDADAMLVSIQDWLHEYAKEQESSTGLHPIVMRAYEAVSKVSFILAAPSRLRTAEHVTWAYALVKRDIDDKMRLVTANDRQKDNPAMALEAAISSIINSDEGQTMGVLVNRLRTYKQDDIKRRLERMASDGKVETFKGARSMRYRLKK